MGQARARFDDESLEVIQEISEHDGMYRFFPTSTSWRDKRR